MGSNTVILVNVPMVLSVLDLSIIWSYMQNCHVFSLNQVSPN